MNIIALKQILKRTFIPKFDEVSLFIIAISFILLIVTEPELQEDVLYFYNMLTEDFTGYFTVAFITLGLFFSIFQIFIKNVGDFQKETILMFVVCINAWAGYSAGMHQLENSQSTLMSFFPVWNILSAGILVSVFRLHILTIDSIVDDKNGTLLGTSVCLGVIGFAFYFSKIKFQMHWSLVFSICVFYATSLNLVILGNTEKKLRAKVLQTKIEKKRVLENSIKVKLEKYNALRNQK